MLEEVVEDYLQFRGYFTTHNVRFKPRADHPDFVRSQDSNASDVDVIGVHPMRTGGDRVMVVTCKAWQSGFDATAKLGELRGTHKNPKRETWRHFRELWSPKWAEAFRETVSARTGQDTFDYRIAVTQLRNDASAWSTDPTIAANLPGCTIGFLTLEEMWSDMLHELKRTPAASDIGRLAQILKAAGLTDAQRVAPPSGPVPGSDAALVDEAREKADPADPALQG